MKRLSHLSLPSLLLAAVVGAGAGVVASVLTSEAIDNYAANLLDDRRFTALAPKKAPTFPGTYGEALEAIEDNSWRSLGVIMPKTVDTEIVSEWLKGDSAKGLGVVVSADGWLLTTSVAFPQSADVNGADVWVERDRYAIEKVVRDSSSPLVLLKLQGAQQLATVGFGAADDMQSGEMIFSVSEERAMDPVAIESAHHEVLFGVQKAEVFTTLWQLEESEKAGLPLFVSTGDLIGFTLPEQKAFPLHYGRGFVQDVVRTGAPRQAALGAYVFDLAHGYNVDEVFSQNRTTGALIVSPSQTRAVLTAGPAATAGLLARDIIIEVDGEVLNAYRSLADALSEYDPGEIANMRIVRAGEVLDIPVTLGDLQTLVY